MENAEKLTNQEELKAIAKRLQALRKFKGYNNYEHIAYELGMSRSAYWRLEQVSGETLVCEVFTLFAQSFSISK
jgi:transcriptional regulator with XRE-family HTH domain